MEKPYAIICRGISIKDGKKTRRPWFISRKYRTFEQLLDAWNNGYVSSYKPPSDANNISWLKYKPVNIEEFLNKSKQQKYAIIRRRIWIQDGKKKRSKWHIVYEYETLEQLLDAWENGFIPESMKHIPRKIESNHFYIQLKPVNVEEFFNTNKWKEEQDSVVNREK